MPSFSGISLNQGIKLIKFVLDKSRLERMTFFIIFPVNSENLLSPSLLYVRNNANVVDT